MKEETISRISYVLFMAWNIGVLIFLVALGVTLLPKGDSVSAIQWYLMTADAILAIIAGTISLIAVTALRSKWIKEGVFSEVVGQDKATMALVKPTASGYSVSSTTTQVELSAPKVTRRTRNRSPK